MEQRWRALIVLAFARVSMGFQFQSIGALSPQLVHDLRLSNTEIGSLIGVYVLPGLALALAGALLGRRFGDRRVVEFGLVLMVAGGVLPGLWPGHAGLYAGRLLGGVGAVLLNVLGSKMVTDWFAGPHLELAMAIYANAYPVGIGIAVLVLGSFAAQAGWPAGMDLTALVALISAVAMLLFYRPHPNDGRIAQPAASLSVVPRRDMMMVALAGLMWALANGAFAIMMGFAPNLLKSRGLDLAATGMLLATLSWLMVGSIQLGATLEDRWPRPNLMVLVGYAVPAVAMLLLPIAAPLPLVLAFGLLGGFPIGVMLALPAQVLHPQHRSIGMGVFYSLMYLGMTTLPALAGWLGDHLASSAAPIYFGALAYLAVLPLFLLFRGTQVGSPTEIPVPLDIARRP